MCVMSQRILALNVNRHRFVTGFDLPPRDSPITIALEKEVAMSHAHHTGRIRLQDDGRVAI
ncbi:hypothetical protein ACE4Z5_25675, partial [Salmonella enterica]|uniref:hypothetical protein n=1 Tax=Salmonella enterica TaxID=28901 RepID=UPI003D2B06F9